LSRRKSQHQLISLWEIMKPFFPVVFTTLYGSNYVPGVDTNDVAVAKTLIPSDTKETMRGLLPIQRRFCAELGLIASIATIDRLLALVDNPYSTWGQMHELGNELRGRLNDELFGTLFFSLDTS